MFTSFSISSRIRSRFFHASFVALPALLVAASGCSDSSYEPERLGSTASAITAATDWLDGMQLGVGFDMLASDARGTCVESGGLGSVAPGFDGGLVTWGISYVEDSESLQRELGIAAGARVKGAGYSASVKVEFAKSVKSSSFKVYSIVRVRVLQAMKVLDNPLLKSAPQGATYRGPAELVSAGAMSDFRRMCGDSYVAGVQGGGELFGVFEIEVKGKSEFERVRADMKAKSGVFSGSASFRESFEAITHSYSSNFSGYKLGGSSDIVRTTDPKEFIEHALGFEADVAANPAVIRALVKDYDTLLNYQGPTPARVGRQLRALEELDRQRLSVQTRLADVDYVLTHANQFASGYDPHVLTQGADQLRAVLNRIEDSIIACTEDLNECSFPEALSLPSVPLPPWSAAVAPFEPSDGDDAGSSNAGGETSPVTSPPLFGPAEVCGVLRHNSRAASPCTFVQGAPILATDEAACGADDVLETVSDARCGVKRAMTCQSMACPGSTPAIPPARRPNEPQVICDFVGIDDDYDPRCGRPARPAFCTDAVICGVAEYNQCAVVVGRQARTCQVGTEPGSYATCEHEDFGVAEYKACWHNADGTAFTGTPPTP